MKADCKSRQMWYNTWKNLRWALRKQAKRLQELLQQCLGDKNFKLSLTSLDNQQQLKLLAVNK